MNETIFIFILFMILHFKTVAQCNCKKEFSFIESYIEENYSGFIDKHETYCGVNYYEFTERFKKRVENEHNNMYCVAAMKEWIAYFKDKHLLINNKIDSMHSTSEKHVENETIIVTPGMIESIKNSSGIEGVYYQYDSMYKIAIVKSPNSWRTYAGVILSTKSNAWTPGMIKFEMKEKDDSDIMDDNKWIVWYPSIAYTDDHKGYVGKMSVSPLGLEGGRWKKQGLMQQAAIPKARSNKVEENVKSHPINEFNMPDSNTCYIRIGSFNAKFAKEIDTFINYYNQKIKTTKYLIIDVSGNGGGSDQSYQPLLPLLYTNPIITTGTAILATSDNIKALQSEAAGMPDEIKKNMFSAIEKMKKHLGAFTPVTNDTFTVAKVEPYPSKIVILISGYCASANEQFLLAAKQSTKVTLMGKHTSGTLDYSNVCSKDFPCLPFTLKYPITRSGRLPAHPVDNIGIMPDITLNDTDDWIKTATQYMKK